MMAPGASSEIPQKFAVFPLEGEPALVVGPDFATNAADLWVRDLHIAGSPVIDTSLTPEALPEEDQRILDLLQSPHGNAKPTDGAIEHSEGAGFDRGANRNGDGGTGAVRKGGDHRSVAESGTPGLLGYDSLDSDGQDGGGVVSTHARRRNQ